MGRADYYKDGDHNVICDRSGMKRKSSDCQMEWNGLMVQTKSFERRQPQDYLRAIEDDQSVNDPRTEATDDFIDDSLGVEEVLPGDL